MHQTVPKDQLPESTTAHGGLVAPATEVKNPFLEEPKYIWVDSPATVIEHPVDLINPSNTPIEVPEVTPPVSPFTPSNPPLKTFPVPLRAVEHVKIKIELKLSGSDLQTTHLEIPIDRVGDTNGVLIWASGLVRQTLERSLNLS